MARIRTVKPEFWTDEKVVVLSPFARLLFIGMWNFVDDEGRAELSPMRLKMQVLPADSVDMSELLAEIRRENLITIYEVDEKEYFQVNGFAKHQRVDKRTPSKLPPPPNSHEFPRTVPTEGKGREKEKEGIKEEDAPTSTKAYAYLGRVIRLNDLDFERWRESFPNLNLRSELEALDAWLAGEGDDKRKRWFQIVAGALAKKHANAPPKASAQDGMTPQAKALLHWWRLKGEWNGIDGPAPGNPLCEYDHLLTEEDRKLAAERQKAS